MTNPPTIALYARVVKEQHKQSVCQFLELLVSSCGRVLLVGDFYSAIPERFLKIPSVFCINASQLEEHTFDYFITLGGDGSFLDGASLVAHLGVPIVGVNYGRLGFLTDVSLQGAHLVMEKILKNHVTIQERGMLSISSENSCLDCFENKLHALNEVTFSKKDTSTLLAFHLYVDKKLIHKYWADGLVISTPTGSTGYNLSCNGPIAFPQTACTMITPMASHNLNIRPLIVPDYASISFQVDERYSDTFVCTLDARRDELTTTKPIHISKSPFNLKVLQIDGYHFVDALRQKLHWGKDSRNY